MLEKISKTNSPGGGIVERVKKAKILIAKERIGFEIAFLFPFLTIKNTVLRMNATGLEPGTT